MKTWLFVLAAALAGSAHADVSVEIGAGQTTYRPQSDGIWYQLGEPHRLDLHGKAYMLGLTGDAWSNRRGGVAWHADYVDLGRLDSWCACTTDENYDYWTHRSYAPGVPGGTFVGTGRARGAQLTLEPYINVGPVRIGYQWGYTYMQPAWREAVYAWPGPTGPMSFTMPIPQRWRVGRMSAWSIGTERASLVYLHYALPSDPGLPALAKGADTLMFVWRFRP